MSWRRTGSHLHSSNTSSCMRSVLKNRHFMQTENMLVVTETRLINKSRPPTTRPPTKPSSQPHLRARLLVVTPARRLGANGAEEATWHGSQVARWVSRRRGASEGLGACGIPRIMLTPYILLAPSRPLCFLGFIGGFPLYNPLKAK